MSMTAARSRGDGARPPLQARQGVPDAPVRRRFCAHPFTFGGLAAVSLAPLVLARRVSTEALLQPAALTLGGWLGSGYAGRQREHAEMPFVRFLGAALGAAAAAGVAHAWHDVASCDNFAAACLATAAFSGAAGAFAAFIGGLVGGSAWSGRYAPASDRPAALAAAVVGAYALSGLGMR